VSSDSWCVYIGFVVLGITMGLSFFLCAEARLNVCHCHRSGSSHESAFVKTDGSINGVVNATKDPKGRILQDPT
jgi:hypothetical protein